MSTEKKAGMITFESLNTRDPFSFTPDEVKEPVVEVVGEQSSLKDEETILLESELGDSNSVTETSREKQTLETAPKVIEQNQYHRQLEKLFEGKVQTVIQTAEDGTEVETPVTELDLDEELYTAIVKSTMERDREEASKDKVSIKGVSDFVQNIIEIEKRGGKITELLQQRQAYIDPLDNLDLGTIEGQRQAFTLRLAAAGRTQEEVAAQLKYHEDRGELEQKAIQADSEIRDIIANNAERLKNEAIKTESDNKDRLKEYRKNIRTHLDNSFELKDQVKARLVDFATKLGEDKSYEFDTALTAARRDPERSAKLALWLMDEKEYNEQVANKKVTETKVSTAIKLGTMKSAKAGDALDLEGGGGNRQQHEFIPL